MPKIYYYPTDKMPTSRVIRSVTLVSGENNLPPDLFNKVTSDTKYQELAEKNVLATKPIEVSEPETSTSTAKNTKKPSSPTPTPTPVAV